MVVLHLHYNEVLKLLISKYKTIPMTLLGLVEITFTSANCSFSGGALCICSKIDDGKTGLLSSRT